MHARFAVSIAIIWDIIEAPIAVKRIGEILIRRRFR